MLTLVALRRLEGAVPGRFVALLVVALAALFASCSSDSGAPTSNAGDGVAPPPSLPSGLTDLTRECELAWAQAEPRRNESVQPAIRACGSVDEVLAAAFSNTTVVNRFISLEQLLRVQCAGGSPELQGRAVCRELARQ